MAGTTTPSYELNVSQENTVNTFAVQGEQNSRILTLHIVENVKVLNARSEMETQQKPLDLTGTTCRLHVKKPDAFETFTTGTVVSTGADGNPNTVTFILDGQTLAAAGSATCTVLITSPSKTSLKAIGITIDIAASDLEQTIVSANEYASLVEALADVQTGLANSQQAVATANAAKAVADVAGASITIAVGTVTTGAPGTSATVTNSGTGNAAKFDFSIPQGIQGAKGDKGDKGDTATSLIIKGVYATLSALQAAHPTGAAGDVYEVGATDSYTDYVWDVDKAAWADIGSLRGPKGDIGASGATGAQGPKGDTGTTGAAGAAATIAVGTVTTGNPGSSAAVTNSGTSSAATFDFTIPQGPKGDTGAAGPQGEKGDTGATGAKGDTGATGAAGAAATVSIGTVTTGAAGSNAAVTNSGTSAAAVFDFTIPKGDKGDAGAAGSGSSYTLPIASTSVLGGVKVGSGLSIASDGTLSASGGITDLSAYMKKGVDYVTAGQKSGTSLGNYATAEGTDNTASEKCSHAEGSGTTASGYYSHAEGSGTTASSFCSHAEGSNTAASGNYSHAEGSNTAASGYYSHAEGWLATAHDHAEHAGGSCNKESAGDGTSFAATNNAFVIGNGTDSSSRSNCFRVTFGGAVYGLSAFNASGADYAEYFEWADGNPDKEDRRGKCVTLDGEKIKYAERGDYILGIVSGQPSVVGDSASESWNGRYKHDIFGAPVLETVKVPEEKRGKETIPAHAEVRFVVNSDYDPSKESEYIPREKRPEWSAIGMMGKLVAVDDGTCEVNGYCVPKKGIMTKANSGIRVMTRIDKSHIKVLMK